MNSWKDSFLLVLTLLFTAFVVSDSNAEEKGDKNKAKLNKINGSPIRAWMNINNISTLIKNDGISDIDASQSNSGFEFPKGSGKQAIYTTGLLWGVKIDGDDDPRVGGSVHRSGLQPGKILEDGSPEDGSLDHVRIYRVRRDIIPENGPRPDNYQVPSLITEERLENKSVEAIVQQYYTDWNEWRAEDGAPFEDIDGNGVYDPAIDIPGFKGADQTIWYVANDVNSSLTTFLFGAQPIGIEMQVTMWAYAQTGALGNMFFRKYTLINKSVTASNPTGLTWNDMYVSLWSDPDVGNSGDDFVGADTTLSLAYAYNANASDPTYNPLPPPAVGYDFFQGPLLDGVPGEDRNKNGIDDAIDYGIFGGKSVGPGKINLPMTAFYYFARGDATVTDPPQQTIQGSQEYYNFFQGRIGKTGRFFVDPTTNDSTTFVLTGDPQTRTGWIDGMVLPADDRRMGMVAGPFSMEPSDTQEVIVAEIAAGAIEGVSRLDAIGLLKFYDKQAQLAYNNFFDLPVAPPAPDVSVVELDRQILLDWSKNSDRVLASENFDEKGYKFQGYNVYQLPSASADLSAGKRIATFDIVDGVIKFFDDVFDVSTGTVVSLPVQFGNDSGLKRYIQINNDELNGGTPLLNGTKYYFAVTSYSYNSDPEAVPNNLENPLSVLTAVPNSTNPGVILPTTSGEVSAASHDVGLSDAAVNYTVIDPTALTGDSYEIYFDQQGYYRDQTGWHSVLSKRALKKDLTGSSLIVSGVWGEDASVNLHYTLDLVSPDDDYADGVQITFPEGVIINSAENIDGANNLLIPVIDGQTVTWGEPIISEDGDFHGGEILNLNVSQVHLPLSVNYVIYDDGWGVGAGDTTSNGIIDAVGIETLTSIDNDFVTQNHWNLRNITKGINLLEDQTVYAGVDIYADANGPGGSAGVLGSAAGTDADPILDGFQISVDGSFSAPTTFSTLLLNGEELARGAASYTPPWDIHDYTNFGVVPATAANAALGVGTSDLVLLQKDYRLVFNGITEIQNINGADVEVTISGGQLATLYAARGYDLSVHPLNPNPGSNDPFTVRIPFEVWSIDDDQQINIFIYDREGDPTVDNPFQVWNTGGRMYTAFVLSPYAETVMDPEGDDAATNATWNIAWYATEWSTESVDIVEILYANPIVAGVDKYSFSTEMATYSVDKAKEDIGEAKVFPNPYYAVNPEEINKYNRFVTFSHLPNKATIRLFNLAGNHVRTIEKDDQSQFQRWDLANAAGLPVASGLYIAYIEMPEIGKTKILKLAIVQEQQILDRF